jgi:hypothetical protein
MLIKQIKTLLPFFKLLNNKNMSAAGVEEINH